MDQLEELTAELPDEPPERSVVLDRDGYAWQRLGNQWLRCGSQVPMIAILTPGIRPFKRLVTEYGPLWVIYRAVADPSVATETL